MVDLKLARLPDRTPVKISVSILPDLHQRLIDYAELYAQTYGAREPVTSSKPGGTLPPKRDDG